MASRVVRIALLLLPLAAAMRPVVWRATKLMSRRVSFHDAQQPLDEFFAEPSVPQLVLQLNPGFETVEKIENVDSDTSLWRGRMAPMRFGPSVNVTSSITFAISHSGPKLTLTAMETSVESTGPAPIRKMIEAIIPAVQSRNTIVVAGDTLTTDATLELKLPLPRWIPLPRKQIEQAGPPILERQMENDLGDLLERIVEKYAASLDSDPQAAADEP